MDHAPAPQGEHREEHSERQLPPRGPGRKKRGRGQKHRHDEQLAQPDGQEGAGDGGEPRPALRAGQQQQHRQPQVQRQLLLRPGQVGEHHQRRQGEEQPGEQGP